MRPPMRVLRTRAVGMVFGLDLVLALGALGAYKLWVYPDRRALFLLGVNLNMMLCALAALAGAVISWRALRKTEEAVFARLLVGAVGALLAGEALAFAAEFLPRGTVGPALETGLSLAGRLGVALLAGWVAFRCPATSRAEWSTTAALLLLAAVAWGAALVMYPAWLDGRGAAALLAAADLLGLVLVSAVLRRGRAGSLARPARLFLLAGLGLFLITDLYYLQHAARDDASFCLAEVGFYAGYLLVAWGAVQMKPDDS